MRTLEDSMEIFAHFVTLQLAKGEVKMKLLGKIFKILVEKTEGKRLADFEHGIQDPLAHPDIHRMSNNQIADLPFERTRTRCDVQPLQLAAQSQRLAT
jgi:hypothetical protein